MASSPRSPEGTLRDEAGEEVCLGDRVVVRGVENGVLRYWGAVQFSAGLWAGVELDGPSESDFTVSLLAALMLPPTP
jgi:hypothetical protein